MLGERKEGSHVEHLNRNNLLKHLFIDYTYYNVNETTDKKFASRLRQMIKEKEQFVPRSHNDKYYESELEKEAKRLDEMI